MRSFSPGSRGTPEKLNPTDGSNVQDSQALEREIGLLLFRVKTGQPKSEGLAKLLENPENLQMMNHSELELHKDQKKTELYREKKSYFLPLMKRATRLT